MRRGLILVGWLTGCITVSQTDNAGLRTARTYVLFVPVTKTVVQWQPRPVGGEARTAGHR